MANFENEVDSLLASLRGELLSAKPANPRQWLATRLGSHNVLTAPHLNKSTAFSAEERMAFGLEGLLPTSQEDLAVQVRRAQQQLAMQPTPFLKHILLLQMRASNYVLFFACVLADLRGTLPLIYTPTVGEGCQRFSEIYQMPQGLTLGRRHVGKMRKVLDNWPTDVDIIVVTDGSRILGLGDLGAGGMGIPVGKLSLYIAASGFKPERTLPIQLDVGTNTTKYLEDAVYIGERARRPVDSEYYAFTDEFTAAVKDKWPRCVLQFEDFSNDHCFVLLERYRHQMRCFNDDIQGTGAVISAGFINAIQLSGVPADKHVIVFFGAGSAGVGVADQIIQLMQLRGVPADAAKKAIYLVDSKGLVTTTRGDELAPHKVPYARTDVPEKYDSLLSIVQRFKPTALIGLAGTGRVFTEDIVREMAKNCERPIIFPLSNPTSKAECTAEEAYQWTDGRCIFAAGSPFDPVEFNGKVFYPGQGNNMYIFPGLGMGCYLSQCREVSDEMIIAAAEALVECVTPEMLAEGTIYPPLENIRPISRQVALRVMEKAKQQGLNGVDYPEDLLSFVESNMWKPSY